MRSILATILAIAVTAVLYANDAVPQPIGPDATVDELIATMQTAPAQERYRYMNAIKQKMRSLNAQQREEALKALQRKMEATKVQQQQQLREHSGQTAPNPVQQQMHQQMQSQQMMQQQMMRQQMMGGRH